jgi:hypothetical protein
MAKMVRDQVLRLTDGCRQLTNPPVTGGQFPHQPPPDWIGQQPHYRRNGTA